MSKTFGYTEKEENMTKIVIIDGHKVVRDMIAAILSARRGLEVTALGKDAYDALRIISKLKPDIAIIDNQLDDINGREIPPLLKTRSPSTAIIILTAQISDFRLYKAVSNEVSGLIDKKTDMDTLPAIVKSISEGSCFISPSLAAQVLHLLAILCRNNARLRPAEGTGAKEQEAQPHIRRLSKSELQILTCIGEGNSSCEIAKILHLSVGTVRNYISAVMHKTGLHSRAQLVLYALKYGLVPLSKP